MRVGLVPSAGGQNRKTSKGRMHSLSIFLNWNSHLFLTLDVRAPGSRAFGLWNFHQQTLSSQAFGLGLVVTPSVPCFSGEP